jgi:hypothetical protein
MLAAGEVTILVSSYRTVSYFLRPFISWLFGPYSAKKSSFASPGFLNGLAE